MAAHFVERQEPKPMLVSSSAKRAITTARTFAKALGDAPITEQQLIYHAPLHALMDIVQHLPEEAPQVMLFGHNPGLSELVEFLANANLGFLAPCTTVRLDLRVGRWAQAAPGTGTMRWWDAPRKA